MLLPLKDHNPTRTFPFFTLAFILANVVVFVHQLALGADGFQRFVYAMGAIPYELTRLRDAVSVTPVPLYLTPITAMFVHGGFLHILGNMLYLWIFGNNIEDALGHIRYFFFYFACGLAATLTHVLSEPSSEAPMVGASGAIAGVLGAYFITYPTSRVSVLFLFWVVRVPAVLVLGLWFLIQIRNSVASVPGTGGVAWFAHIGGFVAGVVLMSRYRRKRQPRRVHFPPNVV
jgi:membrane associated rhomboid family serine protease